MNILSIRLLIHVLELKYTQYIYTIVVWQISFVFGCFIMKYNVVIDENKNKKQKRL